MFRNALFRAALTSSVVMAAGDVACQSIRRRHLPQKPLKNVSIGEHPLDISFESLNTWRKELDWNRTARFAVIGFTLHGPWFFYGFRWLDGVFGPSRSIGTALAKTGLGQLTIFPAYLAAFFTYSRLLEGASLQAGIRNTQSVFWSTYQAGWVFWPAVNVVNFMFIPNTGRVAYVNLVGLLWNSFMSWQDSK